MWRDIRVLTCDGYSGVVLLGQTENGFVYWQACSLPDIPNPPIIAAKITLALASLERRSVDCAVKAVSISHKDFYAIDLERVGGTIRFIPSGEPILSVTNVA